jgi:hypothetical protein
MRAGLSPAGGDARKARDTVFHDRSHASYVELPVVR